MALICMYGIDGLHRNNTFSVFTFISIIVLRYLGWQSDVLIYI